MIGGNNSQIRFIQRYYSKEKVDTSNTILMLSRLYILRIVVLIFWLMKMLIPEIICQECREMARMILEDKIT